MTGPLLLDLCSGDGGAAEGYRRAGFEVVGVDNEPHPYPPGRFILGDAITTARLLAAGLMPDVQFVHASPPCHDHSDLSALSGLDGTGDMLAQIRDLLQQWAVKWGGTYVIENVEGAPLINPIRLCGSEFDLWADCRDGKRRQLRRHRLFESNAPLMGAGGCRHRGQPVGVYGTGGGGQMTRGYKGHPEESLQAMGTPWMSREDVAQAIPPAYTEFIGLQLFDLMEVAA